MHKIVGSSYLSPKTTLRQRSKIGIDFRGSKNSLWFKTALERAEKVTGKEGVLDHAGSFTEPRIQELMMKALRLRVREAALETETRTAPKKKTPIKAKESLRRKSTRRLLALGGAAKEAAKNVALGSKDLVADTASSLTEMALLPLELAVEGFQSFVNRKEIAAAKAAEAELLDRKIPPERIIHSGNPTRPKPLPVEVYKPTAHQRMFDDYMDNFFAKHGITEDDDLREVFPDPARNRRRIIKVPDFSNSMYELEDEVPAKARQTPPNVNFENTMFGETQYEPDDSYADYDDYDPDKEADAGDFDWLNNTLYDD